MTLQLIRMNEVSKSLGLSKATLYKKIKCGSFPQGILISERSRVWRVADIESWLEEQVVGASVVGGENA